MGYSKENAPAGYDQPIALPRDDQQQQQWQAQNRAWWENNPMRYDFSTKLQSPEFSREFYEEIDRRFFSAARPFLPWKKLPFDALIDFPALAQKDVLEIGVGNGSHAQLLATHARSFTGIDLTEYAVKSTSERMKIFGLKANIRRMDAERMEFPDGAFDFIWSWGVIHHSSNTGAIIREMHRVLRPGGEAVVMVYHRSFWCYYVVAGLIHGVLQGDWLKEKSLHRILQKHTDGAIARYYTQQEWRDLVGKHFDVTIEICGAKPILVPLPGGKVKQAVMDLIPDRASAFITNECKMGNFLVARMKRK